MVTLLQKVGRADQIIKETSVLISLQERYAQSVFENDVQRGAHLAKMKLQLKKVKEMIKSYNETK